MRLLLFLFILIGSTSLFGQIERPVCDDVTEIPYTFSYSGFLLQENPSEPIVSISTTPTLTLRLDISVDIEQGEVVYSEEYNLPIDFNGFFNLEIGKKNVPDFMDFIAYLNLHSDKTYYFDLYRMRDQFIGVERYLGSKKILSVPYAYVANSLNGMGPQGVEGVSGVDGNPGPNGADGSQGPRGAQGGAGPDDFGTIQWSDRLPFGSRIYIDDGTNTSDGKPHIRIKVNDQWIDL